MQDELLAADPNSPIRIHAVNGAGHEAANGTAADGRDLPLLQDTVSADVWTSWEVVYRDVIVLDEDNVQVAVFNLTEHNLAEPADYAELKQILENAAAAE